MNLIHYLAANFFSFLSSVSVFPLPLTFISLLSKSNQKGAPKEIANADIIQPGIDQ